VCHIAGKESQLSIAWSLLNGVISSILAVLIIEGYLALRRMASRRALRAVLGLSTKRRALVMSGLTKTRLAPTEIVGVYDALGLAHLLEMCRRVGSTPSVIPQSRIPVDLPKDIIAIGGSLSNPVTAFHLARSCPGFQPCYEEGAEGSSGKFPKGWKCGGIELHDFKDDAIGFIVSLLLSSQAKLDSCISYLEELMLVEPPQRTI
jgi:hypothetical protein